MLIVSNGFKVGILGRKSFADLFNGGKIRVFSGGRPSLAESAEPTDTWLGDITWAGYDVGLQFYQSGPYIGKSPLESWELRPVNSGNANWCRLVGPGDNGGGALDAPRIDCDISTVVGSAELILASLAVAPGTSVPVGGFLFTIPPLIGV